MPPTSHQDLTIEASHVWLCPFSLCGSGKVDLWPSNVEHPHHLSHLSLDPGRGSGPALYAKLLPSLHTIGPLFDSAQL